MAAGVEPRDQFLTLDLNPQLDLCPHQDREEVYPNIRIVSYYLQCVT